MADDPILKAIQGGGGTAVADEEEDPILSAIRGPKPGTNLRTPTLNELATGQSPETQTTPLSTRAAKMGKPMAPLPPPQNPPFIDATKIPLNPLTNRYYDPSQIPKTVEEQQAAERAALAAETERTRKLNPAEIGASAQRGGPTTASGIEQAQRAEDQFITDVMSGSSKMPLPAFTEPGPTNPFPLGVRLSNVGELTDLANEYLGRPDIPKTRKEAFFAGATADTVKTLNDMFLSPIGLTASALGLGETVALAKAGQFGGDALKLAQDYEAMRAAGASGADLAAVETKMKQSILAAAKAQKVASAGKIAGQAAAGAFGAQGAGTVVEGVENKDVSKVLQGLGQAALGGAAAVGAARGGGAEKQVQAETAARATKAAEGEVSAKRTPQMPAQGQQPPTPAQLPPAPVGAGEATIPEKPETLNAQVDALAKGTNKIVYFPKGTQTIPAPPEDANVTIVKGDRPGAGTYYHDDSVTPADIRKAVKNGTYGELLGNIQTKEEAAHGQPAAVVARDEKGIEQKAAVVDTSKPEAVQAQAQELANQFPGANIGVETPEKVVAGRQAPISTPETSAPETGLSPQTQASPQAAYRVRDVGEEGVPVKPGGRSHSHATTSLEEARGYVESRGNIRGKPQEIVKVDLSKLKPEDYQVLPREGQAPWVKFNRPLEESELQKVEPEEEAQEVHIPGITAPIRGGKRTPREKTDLTKYDPDVLEAARTEMQNAADLASSYERPGRYPGVRLGATPNEDRTEGGYAIGSPRGDIAAMFPWYKNFKGGAGKLAEIAKQGKGAAHDELLDDIAARIQEQKAIAKEVVGPRAEELKSLAEQVRDVDPDLAEELEGIANGKYYSANDLKAFVDSKVADATTAAAFNRAFDTLASETAEAENEPGASEPVSEVPQELPEHANEVREEQGVDSNDLILQAIKEQGERLAEKKAEKKPRALPGMEKAVEEQKRAAGEFQGEELTKEINKPAESIEEAAGKMERESPLFRGTAASPQNEMFAAKSDLEQKEAQALEYEKAEEVRVQIGAQGEPGEQNLTSGSTIQSEKEPANAEATQPVGGTGEGALERTSPANVLGAGEGGNAGRAGAESGGPDEGRVALSDRERDELRRGVGSGEGESPVSADRGGRAASRREPGQSVGSGQPGNDYRITEADALGAGGPKEKFRNNVSAIKLVKQLLAEARAATPEEQSTLVKYTGWGWTGNGLFNEYQREWAKERKELQDLLSEEEYRTARASTTNAHYTSPEVVKAVWDAVQRLGFTGGRILEPSAGIGHFLGLMPSDVALNSRKTAIELDHISGNILKQLYQSADTRIQGFEKFQGANNFYDLAISNVPFGDYKVHDPAYNKYALSIHNYFIAKMLDKVRPGGLVAAITTHHTMDAANSKIRQVFADRGDLVGAIRLPNTAFQKNAGTEVTTDVLFFRKRAQGEAPAGEAFLKTQELSAPRGEQPIAVNEYFAKHPSMMLGNMERTGTMYGGQEPTLRAAVGKDLGVEFQKAIAKLPENVMGQHEAPESVTQAATVDNIPDFREVKPHGLTIKNDKVYRRRADSLVEETDFPASAYGRLKGMLTIRDTARELFQAEGSGKPFDALAEVRGYLNRAYDSFVMRHGYLHQRANMAAMVDDPDLPFVLALENWDRTTKKAKKADAFFKQTVAPRKPVTSVETPKEALLVSLAEKGRLDFDHMAKLTGDSPAELQDALKADGLVFESPEGHFETTDAYLSGNVRKKLREAEEAASLDPKFNENVEALKKVQPIDLEPGQIKMRFGSTWLPEEDVRDFINEVILDGMRGARTVVRHVESEALWRIEAPAGKYTAGATQKWGTARANAIDMLEGALNLKQPTVYDKLPDGKTVINENETLAARDKLEQLETEFQDWIFRDHNRAARLAAIYNEKYNSNRLREYDGSHLTLPGASAGITLRPHQKDAIWRAITGGNTGLFHVVGAGKTYTIVGAAMEMRRLGLAKKPMIVVPNHLVGQWAQDFQRLYPQANVLAAGKKDFETANRKEFASRIATGDWDAVIIPHKSFEFLPMSEDFTQRVMDEHLDTLEELIGQMRRAEGKGGRTVKQLEKAKRRLEAKVEKRQNKEAKDQTIKFEELGADALMVDEAHAYKNLMLITKMGNVSGVPKNDSNRAFDMYMKTKYISKMNNGRNVVFATGTPISNTMAEIYTMMRYLDEKRLEEMGLSHFDAWAATFGKTVQTFEVSPEDVTRFRVSSRFSKFMNLPELVTAFRGTGDVKLAEDLNLPIPKLKGDKPETVVVPASPRVLRYVGLLGDRADHIRGYKEVRDAKTGKTHRQSLSRPDPSEDNMLKITGEGRKVALDYRAIDLSAPDEEVTKLNAAVQQLAQIWEEGKARKTTQAVMLDLATPKAKKDSGMFNAYADIKNKLVGRGIPASEIAFIHDAKTDAAKQDLFDKVNAGEVRIILGSTDKMGVGTNIQKRLIALHHLDSPWRPSDIEQREGRILRQGNDNPEVMVKRYVTEGSFDAYMWQGIERKAGFIRDVMKGDPGVREAEDVDGVALSYAEAKALATGNPLVAEKMKVDLDAAKLEKLLAAHHSQQITNKVKLASIPEQIAGHEDYIKRLEQDVATRDEHKGGEFQATVVKGQYTERKDAGAAINGAVEKNRGSDRRKIGEFRGFELYADGSGNAYLQGDATHYFQTNNENPLGTVQSLESTLRGLESKLETRKETIETLKKEQATRTAELNKPFPKQAELDKLLARKKEIDEKLAVNSADPTADAAADKGIEEVKSGEVADEAEPESDAEFGAFFMPRQIQALIDKALDAIARLRGKSRTPVPEQPIPEGAKVGAVPRQAPGEPTEAPPARAKEFAGNIRLDKLNVPEDVINAIRESAKRNKQEFDEQRRGKIPFKQTRNMAEKLVEEGMFTEKDLERMKKGNALNAEELQAARSMLIASAKKVREAAAAIRKDNSVDTVLAFQEALLRHDGIQKAVSGAVAEAGRALSQQRMVANALAGKEKTAHERVLDSLGGKELSEEAARRLAEIPEDDVVALNNFLRSQKQWTTAQKIEAYWIANVLSSPRTPIKKVLGDVVLGTVETGRRFVDVPVDKIMAAIQGRKSETTFREAMVAPLAYVSAIPEGIRKASYIIMHGFDVSDPLAIELPRRYEFPGGVKNPFNAPGRALSAATKFFQVLAFQGELHAQAVRLAAREGLKDGELKDRATDLVQHPTEEMIDAAMKAGEFQTYTERPDALSRILMSMRDKVELPKGIPLIGGLHPMRFVIPFVQIPYNLTKQAFRYSPFGAARLNDFTHAKSPEATKTISRALIGTAIMGLFAYLAAKKLLTGAPPNDPAGRDEFYRSGKQPYSVKFGNRWVSYKAAGPFALTAAAVAAWHDRHEKKETMLAADEVATLAGSMGKALLDESFLRGLKNVMDALNEPDRFAGRWASGTLGGFVPMESALRTLADALDPTVRNPQSMYERIAAGLPVVNKTVAPKLDALGRPSTKEGSGGLAAVFPGGFAKDQPKSDIDAELDRLNKLGLKNVGFAGKHLVVEGYKVALSQDELDRYQKLRGIYLQSYLRQTFNAPEYKQMSDQDKIQATEDAIHQAERDARGAIGDQVLAERLKKVRSASIPRRPPDAAMAARP